MRSHSLEPVTHGPAAAVPTDGMNVAGRQTVAALCILLVTLSDSCINDESVVPALIRVDRWALKSCGPAEATIAELGGIISQLLCCLKWLRQHQTNLPRHDRVLKDGSDAVPWLIPSCASRDRRGSGEVPQLDDDCAHVCSCAPR